MEKYYRFAGVELCVRIPEDRVYRSEGHLAPFAASTVRDPWCFDYEPVTAIPAPVGTCVYHDGGVQIWESGNLRQIYRGSVARNWESAYLCTQTRGRENRVLWKEGACPGPLGIRVVLEGLNVPHLITQAGGCILHCSYIEHEGKAILFTAPSGVGKSTQAELWRQHRDARIINGDRAAVGLVDGVPMAQAIPFAGSSQYCVNRSVPLAAIVCLGQAKENRIAPITGAAAFRSVWEGCTVNVWDGADMALASQTITDLIQSVPVCKLECLPDASAVAALDEFLKGR